MESQQMCACGHWMTLTGELKWDCEHCGEHLELTAEDVAWQGKYLCKECHGLGCEHCDGEGYHIVFDDWQDGHK